jgi:HlyD family secretion protein
MCKIVKRPLTFAVAGLMSMAILACGNGSSERVTVNVVPAADGRVVRSVEISGVLAPDRTANIFSRLSGQAREVAADIGDAVRSGQLLIRIDTRELDAQLEVARAAVEAVQGQAAQAKIGVDTARNNLDLAQKSYDRVEALFKSQAVPQNQLDDARNKLDQARSAYQNADTQYRTLSKANLEQARAQVHLIEVQISNSLIHSPIDGVVTNRDINPGELVSPGVALMTIADTSTLKLLGTVSQEEVPLLDTGRKVLVKVDGMPDRSFSGAITQIGPVAVSTGQYFPVVVSLRNDGRLMAGMTAMASFEVGGSGGVMVPLRAVQSAGDLSYVYVVNDGKVSRRRVTIGLLNSGEAEVTDGLQAGELVAASNVDLLEDGLQVHVVE